MQLVINNKDQYEDVAFERANKVTFLLKNRNDFHDVYEALKAKDQAAFEKICERAKIEDPKLIADIWKRWLQMSERMTKSTGPIW